ncbi:unnamed protein product [Spodoptera littoralis]|uniref:DUF243 domain-containing protein n=1 Tax=Spodoptera littoralis TaxID=7109 RepID=A0A9P0IIJ2_SPOLI|nr:unnamed protein product [Spodoptera littoralis]CAH1647658.1 unnamed protein product [Spodoptera littoralis]
MSLVLVLSVISLALADAGYQYNTPSTQFGLPGSQPANFRTGHDSHHHSALPNEQDKLSHSVSYKDYVYLKNDVYQNKEDHRGFINYSSGNGGYAASQVNNGYVNSGYPQSIPPVVASSANLNTNSAQNYAQVVYNYNSGNNHNFAPTSGGNVNGYSQIPAPSGINANIGYQYNNNQVLNSGYSSATSSTAASSSIPQPLPQSGAVGLSNGYAQAPSGNVLNNYSQASGTASHALSHGYSQNSLSPAIGNSNSGYSHVLVPYSSSSILNNNYAQSPLPVVGSNVNSAYSQSFPPIGSANSISNGYIQASSSTAGTNYNSGYSYFPPNFSASSAGSSNSQVQTSFSSPGSSFNRGYSQHNSNINTGYSQSYQIGQSVSNGFSQPIQSTIHHGHTNSNNDWKPLISQTSSSLNTGTVQASGASYNGNLNSISQSSATTQTGSSNGIYNTGFTQSANIVGSSSSLSSSAPIAPTVFKHIYFHVPPPEVEDPKTAAPPPPPKKNYKIIFIKVPSQESKSNLARLQQIAEMSNASVEHKTLIYVLVKNPETQQPVVLPKSTPSEHEVFFVKYNGDPLEIAEQVNKELDKTGTVQSIVPLDPGLVNGKK